MKMKKVLALVLALCLAMAMGVGATLAYLQATDKATNTFTVGNVAIDLTEDFENLSKLMPATGSAQDGTLKNGVEKKVYVTNTGSEAAYVRVHIAIPTILDDGDPNFDASKNVLHFNYNSENVGADKWDWSKTTGAAYEGDWNFYTTTIDSIAYNVYVVTYEAVLAKGVKTVDAMSQVYLDSKVSNEDISKIKETLGDEWKILVVAEGVQAAGFENAYEALNTAFGVPGTAGYDPFN